MLNNFTEKKLRGLKPSANSSGNGPNKRSARRQIPPPKSKLNHPLGQPTARIYYADGRVSAFSDELIAGRLWRALPRGSAAAFRGKRDQRPVLAGDYQIKP